MQYFQTLVVSLILHLLIVSILDKLPDRPQPSEVPIDIVYPLSAEELQKQRTLVRETDKEEQKKLDEKKKARFLSEKTKRVEQETRVQQSGMTQNAGATQGRPRQAAPKPEVESQEHGPSKISKRFVPDLNPLRPTNPGKPGPSAAIGEKLPDDVKFGNFNALNTDRYLYYTFFARVEERIRPRWESQVKQVIQNTNQVSRKSEWITQIEILLSRKGEFQKVILHKKSGLDSLDLAAIEAFRAGSPYQNPPEDMVQADGRIHLFYSISVSAAF